MTEKNNHKLRVAVVQFPVSGDMDRNYRYMASWIRRAAEKGAELVHFPETALTGYYKVHLDDTSEIDRGLLEECSLRLRSLAGELGLWLTYGSTHFTADSEKPYNCLYLVGPDGEETCRYDKVFLTDTDVECYAPGNRLVTAGVKGFKVGLTICFDMRFPELFRKYMADGVNLFLISSYQAGGHRADHMRKVAPSTLITRAAENGIFISAANTSQRPSWHESMIISFNGIVLAKARRHRASMAVATLDSREYEPFTDFIRETARSSMQQKHPLLPGEPLGG